MLHQLIFLGSTLKNLHHYSASQVCKLNVLSSFINLKLNVSCFYRNISNNVLPLLLKMLRRSITWHDHEWLTQWPHQKVPVSTLGQTFVCVVFFFFFFYFVHLIQFPLATQKHPCLAWMETLSVSLSECVCTLWWTGDLSRMLELDSCKP